MRRSPEKTTEKTGLGAYSDKIEKGLTDNNIEFERVSIDIDKKKGYLGCLMRGFIRPFFKILAMKDVENTYHVTDELCSLYLPMLKGKKIVTFHHVLRKDDNTDLFALIWKFIARIAIKQADTIIAASPQTKKELMESYGIPEEKISVVLSSVGDKFRKLENVKKEKKVGCIGTLSPRKNTSAAIRVFSKLVTMSGMDDLRLVICGKGPEYQGLVQQAYESGVGDKVDFCADLSEEEVVEFYNKVTVLINPSMHEGYGLATLEAQKCSTPVVYFEYADIPSEITKYAIPSKDDQEFADNIHRLISDDEYREKIEEDGKRYAETFGDDFISDLLETYGLKRD